MNGDAESPALSVSLGFRAWLATYGCWERLYQALNRHDSSTRSSLQGQLRALANPLYNLAACNHPWKFLNIRAQVTRIMENDLPRLALSLTAEQFAAVIALTALMADRRIDPLLTLQRGIPAASNLTPEQFSESMKLSMHLTQQGVGPCETLSNTLPAIAKLHPTEEQFHAALQALKTVSLHPHAQDFVMQNIVQPMRILSADLLIQALDVAVCLAENNINPHKFWRTGLTAALADLTEEQISLCLAMAMRLAQRRIDPSDAFANGIPSLSESETEAQRWQQNLQALEALVTALPTKKITAYAPSLSALFRRLPPKQFTACLQLGTRLAKANVDPSDAFKYGFITMARTGLLAEGLEENLSLQGSYLQWEKLLRLLQQHSLEGRGILTVGLSHAADVLPPEEFPYALDVAARLAGSRMDPHTQPGIVPLTRQALALMRQYDGYRPYHHSAITESISFDQFIGESRHEVTATKYPAWIEMLPMGARIAPFPLEIVESQALEAQLLSRSWLWRFYADEAAKERAKERIADLRIFLPEILDPLFRQGVLEADDRIKSVYLIGSYPWVAGPNDVNLFLVMEGEGEARLSTSEGLTAYGVRLPEQFTNLSLERAGYENLIRADRGEQVSHAGWMASRYHLLFGSVLLAGSDLFGMTRVSHEALGRILDALLADYARADWPELEGNLQKIAMKKRWREAEASALAQFISRPAGIPTREFWRIFRLAQQAELIESLAPLLAVSFQKVAQAAENRQEQEGLQEFQIRYGVGFREVRDGLRAMKGLIGIENVRRKAAAMILAACPVRLQIDELLTASQAFAPEDNTLLRAAGFTPSESDHLLHPAQPPTDRSASQSPDGPKPEP